MAKAEQNHRTGGADRVIPVAAALLFFGLGLALSLLHSPMGDQGVEADFFAELAPSAQQLAAGEFSVDNYPFKGPVYSILLAGVHALLAPLGVGWYRAGVVLSLLASALTLLLLYRLTLRWAGREAAVVVLLLTGVTKVFFIHAGKAASDHIFVFFVLAAAHHLLMRPGHRSTWLVTWLVTGLLAGAAFLTRYIGAVVPVWCLAVVLLFNPDSLPWRRRLQGAVFISAGFLLVLTPWLVLTRLETGSLLVTQNLQNIVLEFYAGDRADLIPAGGFASGWDLVRHDPGHFFGHFGGNLVRHAVQDFQQLTGRIFGSLALLGYGLMFWRRPDRRLCAWLTLGGLYFLALCTVFYVPRFSLLLAPFHALAVAHLLGQTPRFRVPVTVVVVAVLMVAHVGHIRRATAFYSAQQPVHLAGAISFLSGVEPAASGRPAVVMARRAHLAHYAGLGFQPYPGRIGGAADLLRSAARRQADYLAVGTIERNYLTEPTLLDHLEVYEGVELVYADGATRVFRLRPDLTPDYATRREVRNLGSRWQQELNAGSRDSARQLGLELGRILSEDGQYTAARDVLQKVYAAETGPGDPTVGLNLAWLCLQVADTEHGLTVVSGILTDRPDLAGTAGEARCLALRGQLLAQKGDYPAARAELVRARDRYRSLGRISEAEAAARELDRLPPR